jgi:hypothetical protein
MESADVLLLGSLYGDPFIASFKAFSIVTLANSGFQIFPSPEPFKIRL